jgi:hypothetical protein
MWSILTTNYAFSFYVVCSLHTLCSLQPDNNQPMLMEGASTLALTCYVGKLQTPLTSIKGALPVKMIMLIVIETSSILTYSKFHSVALQ